MDPAGAALTAAPLPRWVRAALLAVPAAFLLTFYAWPVLTLLTRHLPPREGEGAWCYQLDEGGQRYRITCAIRFRKQDSKALFAWVVRGTDKLLRDAFADIAARVSQETGVPALAGSPEASS